MIHGVGWISEHLHTVFSGVNSCQVVSCCVKWCQVTDQFIIILSDEVFLASHYSRIGLEQLDQMIDCYL